MSEVKTSEDLRSGAAWSSFCHNHHVTIPKPWQYESLATMNTANLAKNIEKLGYFMYHDKAIFSPPDENTTPESSPEKEKLAAASKEFAAGEVPPAGAHVEEADEPNEEATLGDESALSEKSKQPVINQLGFELQYKKVWNKR